MTTRGIAFMPALALAIREGRKTVTRRVVDMHRHGWPLRRDASVEEHATDLLAVADLCPYGVPGDTLYIREPRWAWGRWVRNGKTKTGRKKWRFTQDGVPWVGPRSAMTTFEKPTEFLVGRDGQDGWVYRHARFMPRAEARTIVTIEDIRVERLSAITEDEALAEGADVFAGQDWWQCFCESNHDSFSMSVEPDESYRLEHGITHVKHEPGIKSSARDAFLGLWNRINGDRSGCSVNDNPYVWVIRFRKVDA